MKYGGMVKKTREKRGFSQSELAVRAGVGLATLQNIEADRANPSLKTLESIFAVLRIKIRFEQSSPQVDRGMLAVLGLPLMSEGEAGYAPTRTGLLSQLAAVSLDEFKGREVKALSSWLHAIHDHYPSTWNEVAPKLRAWAQNQETSPKLRRLALARLGKYL